MNAPEAPQVLEFSGFVLDGRQRRLLGPDGTAIAIPARAFDLLLYLAEHPGELLDKRRLMDAVWPNVIVEENNLSQHISTLRKLLGEAPGEHRFIITVPGRGLRFVPAVQRLGSNPGASAADAPSTKEAPARSASVQETPQPDRAPVPPQARRRSPVSIATLSGLLVLCLLGVAGLLFLRTENKPPTVAAELERPSVVVLPFADISPNQDQQNFTDGLSEELMNALGRLPGLRVLGRTSSFAFKGQNEDVRKIAATLGVNHVLEGSVRRDGDKLRITAQLVEASTGSQKWANTFDGSLSDVFSVQEDIANSVASALSLALLPEQNGAVAGGTTNLAAYEAYLSARAVINTVGVTEARTAIEDLERAVSIDPQFALAWASLAEAYTFAVDFPPASALPLTQAELQRRISAAALRAFELAPNAPQTLRSAGSIAMQNRDWIEAGRRFQKAVELAPFDFDANLFEAWFFINVGRPRDAIPYLQRAVRAEPLLARPVAVLAATYDMTGDTEKALALLETSGSLKGDPSMALNTHLSILLGRGDAAAIREFLNRNPLAVSASFMAKLDDRAAALADLRSLYANRNGTGAAGGLYAVAAWAPYLGDPKLALDALRAVGPTQNVFVIWQPAKKAMRQLPEFKKLVQEFGLVDYWRSSGSWAEFCRPQGDKDFECQ